MVLFLSDVPSPTAIKETNLSTENAVADDCLLKETNLFKVDSVALKSSDEGMPIGVTKPKYTLTELYILHVF